MAYQIHITQSCNLACTYCCQAHKDREKSMSAAIALKTADFIVKHALQTAPGQGISLNITGGEPLLRFDLFKLIMDYIRKEAHKHTLPPPYLELSTNATLLNREHLDYLQGINYSLFIGFDGIKSSHDLSRRYAMSKRGSYDDVYANIRRFCLDDERVRRRTTLNMVVAPANVPYLLENFQWLYNLPGCRNVSMNIAGEQHWNESTLAILEEQLYLLADYYVQILTTRKDYFALKLFDDQIARTLDDRGFAPGKCGAARNVFTCSTDGSLYACGGFSFTGINESDITIGSIYDGVQPALVEKFLQKASDFRWEECSSCAFQKKCFNYCPALNYLGSKNMGEVSYNHCEVNKRLIMAVDRIIDRLYKDRHDLFMARFRKDQAAASV